MKKNYSTILTLIMILAIGGIFIIPDIAVAETTIVEKVALSGINSAIAGVANFFLQLSAWLLTVFGTFLSVSINLTMNIRDIVASVPSIQTVWVIVRDISSIFIIFALLYASIKTILGLGGSGLNKLIINVFVAGILINFSLFFVKIMVDASNLVSLQFYNAIAPQTSANFTTASAYYDGGLSNIFMNSLRIPAIYENTNTLKSADVAASIGFATVGGIIITVTAAFSFLAAALAFTIRTGIILFVMALSPLWFAGLIFPEIKKDVSDKLLDLLKTQLTFMPVYLFLLYIALKFISDPKFTAIFNPTITGSSGGFPGGISIGVILQYTIAIIFINAPLVIAIRFGGMGMKWAPGMESVTGFFGQHSFGRAAKAVRESDRFKGIAARNPSLGILADKGLGKVSGATFLGSKGGYDKQFKDYTKDKIEFGKKLKTPESVTKTYVNSQIAAWDNKVLKEKASLGNKLNEIRQRKDGLDKLMKTGTPAQKELAYKKLKDLEEEENVIKQQLGKDVSEARGKEIERLKKEGANVLANEFASNLESGWFLPTTKKARKEVADAIRKDMKKGKKDKAIDAIKDLLDDTEKEGGKGKDEEEKPKTT